MYSTNENIIFPKLCLSTGEIIELEHELITNSVFKALKAAENPDRFLALNLSDKVMQRIALCKKASKVVSIDEVHDITEFVMIENGLFRAAKEYKASQVVMS